MTKIKKEIKTINAYCANDVYQFWYEDGILHMWTTERSGLYTLALDSKRELHFLADMSHHPKEGTVYEFQGIFEIERDKDGKKVKV